MKDFDNDNPFLTFSETIGGSEDIIDSTAFHSTVESSSDHSFYKAQISGSSYVSCGSISSDNVNYYKDRKSGSSGTQTRSILFTFYRLEFGFTSLDQNRLHNVNQRVKIEFHEFLRYSHVQFLIKH